MIGRSIQIRSVKAAFSVGYTYTTLREIHRKPGVTVRTLPPAPQPGANDVPPRIAGSQSSASLDAGLPSFSIPTFHRYLVKFVIACDQVSLLHLPSLIYWLTFEIVP